MSLTEDQHPVGDPDRPSWPVKNPGRISRDDEDGYHCIQCPTGTVRVPKSHPPRWEELFGFGGGRMSWLLSGGLLAAA